MTHWQNFYHDATAEELDRFGELIVGRNSHRVFSIPMLQGRCAQIPFPITKEDLELTIETLVLWSHRLTGDRDVIRIRSIGPWDE